MAGSRDPEDSDIRLEGGDIAGRHRLAEVHKGPALGRT